MDGKSARRDREIARLAKRQHGVIAVKQLHALGVSDDAVRGRARAGRLHRVHRGVYAVGHSALSSEAQWMAAVLACGGRRLPAMGRERRDPMVLETWQAALSHRSAAVLWQLLPPGEGLVNISTPTHGGRANRKGIRLHRSITLQPADVTLRSSIPVTTPARTIADLRRCSVGRRRVISPWELRRAIRQADVLGLSIGEETGRDRTRSDLERDFLRLCRRHRLPKPEVNVRVGRYLVDFLWRDRMLIVETDGYRYHRGRAAFEDDRARDLALRATGHEVVRVADRQVDDEPDQVARVIRTYMASFPSGGRETRQAAP
jgi:very-short-patch-repair endonuclease